MISCTPVRTQYAYLSKDKIKNFKKIGVIIQAEKELPGIIDIDGGIRSQTGSYFSDHIHGGGVLGGLVQGLVLEGVTQYKISNALGKNERIITQNIDGLDAIKTIFQGISNSFSMNTQECSYIDFINIEFLSHYDKDNFNQPEIDNVLHIRYVYGIGVSDKYPPQPSIVAKAKIYNPKTKELLEEAEIQVDSISLYNSIEEIPSLEKYSENNSALFKADLKKISEIMGAEMGRLYTYY